MTAPSTKRRSRSVGSTRHSADMPLKGNNDDRSALRPPSRRPFLYFLTGRSVVGAIHRTASARPSPLCPAEPLDNVGILAYSVHVLSTRGASGGVLKRDGMRR